jgi:Transposase IS116/IS110/IS902 family
MTKWNTEKQFSSFLGLCPDNSISGGKVLRRSTRKVYNRAADTLRLCAQSLTHSKSALRSQIPSLKSQTRRSQSHRGYGPPSCPPSLPHAPLRTKLRRKRHPPIRTQIPPPTHQMAPQRSQVTQSPTSSRLERSTTSSWRVPQNPLRVLFCGKKPFRLLVLACI